MLRLCLALSGDLEAVDVVKAVIAAIFRYISFVRRRVNKDMEVNIKNKLLMSIFRYHFDC